MHEPSPSAGLNFEGIRNPRSRAESGDLHVQPCAPYAPCAPCGCRWVVIEIQGAEGIEFDETEASGLFSDVVGNGWLKVEYLA